MLRIGFELHRNYETSLKPIRERSIVERNPKKRKNELAWANNNSLNLPANH